MYFVSINIESYSIKLYYVACFYEVVNVIGVVTKNLRVLYLHRKHTSQIARIVVTSFKLHEPRSNLLQFIENQYIQFYYNSLGILLKEIDKLKNDTVLFLREKHNRVSSFCRVALKMILSDSPFNFGRYTQQLIAESSKL